MIHCRHVFVSGRVQGVGFRWHARTRAESLGLSGWVRNLEDGRLEAWLEGSSEAVASMLAWLEQGPAGARVTGVEVRESAHRGLAGFVIERGA